MKKLMIVAVAAAMAGVASAKDEEQVVPAYKFTATLKTTKGKAGKVGYSDYYQLGFNPAGEAKKQMWYNATDSIRKELEDAGVLETKPGKSYPTLKLTSKGTIAFTNVEQQVKLEKDLKEISNRGWNQKSEGQICSKFRVVTWTPCYRVVGSRKLTADLCNSCCDQDGVNVYTNNAAGKAVTIEKTGLYAEKGSLIHFFGAQSFDKCNKIEIYTAAAIDDFKGYVAGQGALDKYGMAKSISGNIVGSLDAPLCKDCCTEPVLLPQALAFSCQGEDKDLEAYEKGDGNAAYRFKEDDFLLNKTAAFGSFRVKANGTVTLAEKN